MIPATVATSAPKRRARMLAGAPIISLSIIAIFLAMVVLGQAMTLHAPNQINLALKLHPPALLGGSWEYPLGTDWLGRDLYSRIVVGARASFVVVVGVLLVGGLGGAALGVISGYVGGTTDALIMRCADATLAFPIILLAVLITVTMGPGTANLIIALCLVLWARFARIVRGQVLVIREQNFVVLARSSGVSGVTIMLRHVVPNVVNTLIVVMTLQIGWIIIVEASLSFLGAGIPPPTPAWGSMAARGRDFLTTGWWVPAVPCLSIALVCLSFNIVGDWLRDRLDPSLRGGPD